MGLAGTTEPRISHQRPSQESPPARQDSRFNNALTSRSDSTRPIIFFGTFLAVFASSARFLNEDAALAVELVEDPEQRHHVASDAPDHHARRVPGRMPALREMDHARDPD